MPRTLMGKTRPQDQPWLVYESADGSWTWKVLKAYSGNDEQQYARWFCAVSSPMTYGSVDLGDTYVADVVTYGHLVHIDDDLVEANYVPPRRDRLTPVVF